MVQGPHFENHGGAVLEGCSRPPAWLAYGDRRGKEDLGNTLPFLTDTEIVQAVVTAPSRAGEQFLRKTDNDILFHLKTL